MARRDFLRDEEFQRATIALGTTLLRMPGGSWSNYYDWLACETGDPVGCEWTWAARPSELLSFLDATGLPGMWTVRINGTAEESAALVAFAIGTVDDERVIGPDRNGRDWLTVVIGLACAPRAATRTPYASTCGTHRPVGGGQRGVRCRRRRRPAVCPMGLGGRLDLRRHRVRRRPRRTRRLPRVPRSDAGGGPRHPDPFRRRRRAAQLGGTTSWPPPATPSTSTPCITTPRTAVSRRRRCSTSPRRHWPVFGRDIRAGYERHGIDVKTPIAVTEHNMVSVIDNDDERLMTTAVNAFYLADTIGQFAVNGITIANLWNIVNGRAANGIDYGLIDGETGERSPAYYSMVLWSRFGDEVVDVEIGDGPDLEDLSIYGGRGDGSVRMLVINPTDSR